MNRADAKRMRVVVFGNGLPFWMAALAPDAPVWRGMSQVHHVVLAPDLDTLEALAPARDGMETVVVPVMEIHAYRCPSRFKTLMPDKNALAALGNKATFAVYAKTLHLSHLCPKTYANYDDVEFPCVVKRLFFHSGIGIATVKSRDEMKALLASGDWRGQSVTVQALVPGTGEYVTHCVCENGKILWHCTYAYDLPAPDAIRGQTSNVMPRAAAAAAQTLAQLESFLRPLAYNGPCNADYKLAANGDIVLFEIGRAHV